MLLPAIEGFSANILKHLRHEKRKKGEVAVEMHLKSKERKKEAQGKYYIEISMWV